MQPHLVLSQVISVSVVVWTNTPSVSASVAEIVNYIITGHRYMDFREVKIHIIFDKVVEAKAKAKLTTT